MDKIILIAQQIAKEGKTPNTAMIKARLPKNIPLPTIIQGLKLWQDNPNKEINTPTEPALIANTDSIKPSSFDQLLAITIEEKVKTMITPLQDEIAQLKAQLKSLQESQ